MQFEEYEEYEEYTVSLKSASWWITLDTYLRLHTKELSLCDKQISIFLRPNALQTQVHFKYRTDFEPAKASCTVHIQTI